MRVDPSVWFLINLMQVAQVTALMEIALPDNLRTFLVEDMKFVKFSPFDYVDLNLEEIKVFDVQLPQIAVNDKLKLGGYETTNFVAFSLRPILSVLVVLIPLTLLVICVHFF